MKINHIQADNFLKLNLFDVNLDDATVHVFAGNNEAGKSSVQEAIRFALTGEVVRVTTKSDYKLMIRDGAKSGTVGVKLDGVDIIRDIKTGKETTDDRTVQLPEYLPYLLNAQQFAKQKPEKRRSFLIGLTGTKVGAEDVTRRMKAKGVNETCIETVIPMLRSGFTATHKEAYNRAAEVRQQWVGLTGNARYGSQIAADWKPTLPENFDHKDYLDKQKKLEQIKASIDQLNIKKGGLIAKLDETKKAWSASDDPVSFKQADLTKVNKEIEQLEITLRNQEITHKDLSDQYFNAKDKSPVTCCECGSLLKVEFTSEPGKGRIANCEPYKPLSDSEIEKLQADIFTIGSNITKLKGDLSEQHTVATELEDNKIKAKQAKKSTITQDDVIKLETEINDLDIILEDAGGDYNCLNETVTHMQIIAEKIKDADETTRRAQGLHKSVQEWEKCVEALAPDGIPAEILSDTLKPVNDRLRNTANVTGWPQVTIDPTMEIIVDGRRYSLLSESAQWRADAAITDAIAHLSGLGLMIIDRMDVLDVASRGKFMMWIDSIMSEYDTILVFATLKLPPSLPNSMRSHWIANGEVGQFTPQAAA